MMNITRLLSSAAGAAALALMTGCVGPTAHISGQPNPVAYRPHNPDKVSVKVSLSKEQVYVMEGDRPLLVCATTVGLPGKPTPVGTFRVIDKIPNKRSASYGFYKSGDSVVPGEAGKGSGSYIGYPMPYWVEFKPEYGFHQGYVWPIPHTHGCLRLHKNTAAKFYALVKVGTPVNIAVHQPEDETIGKNVARPTDYNDPDPDPHYMISPQVFSKPEGPLLQD